MTHALASTQRGATLIVGLIMLVLITLMVTTAMTMSTANLKVVGNMQFRDEAIAAANLAIEQILSSSFSNAPTAETINIDIDNNGTTDYEVVTTQPQCIRATQASTMAASSLSLPTTMSAGSTWNTTWDITATVTPDGNAGGTSVSIRTGMRVLLNQTQKDAVCP